MPRASAHDGSEPRLFACIVWLRGGSTSGWCCMPPDEGMVQWHRSLLLRLVCGLATLAGHGSGLFFELKQMSQGGSECFKAKPGQGHRLIGSYEADGPSEGVTVKVFDPKKKELWKSTDSSAKFSIAVVDEGQHELCFDSTIDESSQMISFNYRVDPHGDIEDPADVSHMQFVTKDHTDKVGELVSKLEMRANDILDQQQYAITREAVHRDTAESTNSRVVWWTLVEVAALIALAAFQVYYLRSYFEVKQVV